MIWRRNENIIEFHLQFFLHNKYNFLFALYKDANTTNTTAKPQQRAKSQTQNDIDETTIIKANHTNINQTQMRNHKIMDKTITNTGKTTNKDTLIQITM